ncbi:hypothetical protein Aduo_008547 [Ancylostoma duodenale]
MVCLFLAFPLLVAVAASESMVCSKFGYNWAAEIRCLRALLSQCKRSSNNRESVDIARIIANLTEHFENRLRKLKDVMQVEQQERITTLQARLENELRIAEMKIERKFSDFKRKQESEMKKLMKRLDLAASRTSHYNDKEYIFVQDRKSWYEAEEDCLTWGGHLTSISDENENSFVRGLLRTDSAWIGVNDVQVENIFVHSDKTPVAYKNFQEGEPDNASHNENCVAMEASGEWVDAFCLVTKPFICKR